VWYCIEFERTEAASTPTPTTPTADKLLDCEHEERQSRRAENDAAKLKVRFANIHAAAATKLQHRLLWRRQIASGYGERRQWRTDDGRR
jgi:ferric-dicitrate binding protein FerR (iron transport regulator)